MKLILDVSNMAAGVYIVRLGFSYRSLYKTAKIIVRYSIILMSNPE